MKSRRMMTLAAAVLAGALGLAGCGGSSGGAEGEPDGPITIGVITSLSGQFSVLGGFTKNTVDLLAEQLNEHGGIDGREVRIKYVDDHTDPTQAALAVKKLLAENPTAIIGPVSSSSCAAIVDTVDRAGVPMVTTCATDSQVNPVRKNVFMATLPTPGMAEQLGNYLEAVDKARIAVLYDQTDFGTSGFEALKALDTVDIVADSTYQLTATTFLPQLRKVLKSSPDAVVVWGAGPPLVSISKEYRQLGAEAPLTFPGAAATPLFLGPMGSDANGAVMASSLANVVDAVPDGNPSKELVEHLAQSYQEAYDEEMSQFTADTCGAWQVITSAIEAAGTDPAAVRDAIEESETVGCHGTYSYSADDHRGLSASDVWVVTNQDGKLTASDFSVAAAGN